MKIKLEPSLTKQTSLVDFKNILEYGQLTKEEYSVLSEDMKQGIIQNFVDSNFDTPCWEVVGWDGDL